MGAGDKTVTFGIKVEAESNADDAASSVEELHKRLTASQDAIKAYGSSLRNLRGNTEEVKDAKEKLKAAVQAERDKITQSTLALGKHGTTVLDVGKKTKEAATKMDALKNAFSTVGGPASEATSKLETLKSLFAGVNSGAVAAVVGVGALVAAMALVTVAVGAATVSLAKFILESGNFLRAQNLSREAASGSASNVKAMGHQFDELASKIPMPIEKMHELELGLTRTFKAGRAGGQAFVDTMNAIGQVASANGDEAGKAIEEVLTRGSMLGRMGLGVNELSKAGIEFTDVARQLAKNLKEPLLDAQNQLVMHRVKTEDGAKAIREVAEKQFGNINARKMLDLNVMSERFHYTLQKLTKDVDLEPILGGIQRLGRLFDTSSTSGKALKQMIETFGKVMTAVFVAALPSVELFFVTFINQALKFEIMLLDLGIYVKKTFGIDFKSAFGDGTLAISLAQDAFWGLAAAVGIVGGILAVAFTPFVVAGYAVVKVVDLIKAAFNADWGAIGRNILEGLANGIEGGIQRVKDSVSGVVDSIKETFTRALYIHSPSLLFEGYGKNTVEGYAKGIDGNQGKVKDSVSGMADDAASSAQGVSLPNSAPASVKMSAGGSGGNTFNITVNVKGGDAKDIKAELTSPNFRAQLIKAFEEMLVSAGIPTQTPQGSVT